MSLRIAYLVVLQVFGWLALLARSDWWYPALETAFVPESYQLDNQSRLANSDNDPIFNPNVNRDPSLPYIPLSKRVPAVLSTIEVLKYYDGKVQGEHRIMQIQPAGSTSPWAS